VKNIRELTRLGMGLIEKKYPDIIILRMGSWGQAKRMRGLGTQVEPSCFTAACAIGLHGFFNPKSRLKIVHLNHSCSMIPRLKIKNNIFYSFDAIMRHFDLNTREVDELFMPTTYSEIELESLKLHKIVGNRIMKKVREYCKDQMIPVPKVRV